VKTSLPVTEAIQSGRATCLFSDDFSRVQLDLEAWAGATSDYRVVSVQLDTIDDVSEIIESLLKRLASVLLLLWPDWYGGKFALDERAEFDRRVTRLRQENPRVDRKWLTAVATRCRRGEVPYLKRYAVTTQARQLRQALAQRELIVAIYLPQPDPPAEPLYFLARISEWLSQEAEAALLLILPSHLRERTELDSINSRAFSWPPHTPQSTGQDVAVARAADAMHTAGVADTPPTSGLASVIDEQKHVVCPVIGRPHPGSPGEQLLARQLELEEDLRDMFQFNQRLETVFENRFLVDLLWSDGRLVVEIDGYGWHSTRSAFHADRQRDYELTLSGYLVLRLTHDFVMEDPQLACSRIRELVEFRRRYPFPREVIS
jgi:very-short-patch-repair endonuclease